MPTTPTEYAVGIMMLDVESKDSDRFRRLVDHAVQQVQAELTGDLALRTDLFAFQGPHLVPGAGAYAPLDFLQIGIAEKLERKLPFLLMITEVDLSSSSMAFALALPSQLTNVGVVSSKRLDPGFWGDDPDFDRAASRLTSLLLHTFGHLLNLHHNDDRGNVMYPIERVEDLDGMSQLTAAQRERIRVMLPREAHDTRAAGPGVATRWSFTARMIVADAGSIARAVIRANPFRLATRMPTMIAAALSVIIVLLFSAETWDVAAAVTMSHTRSMRSCATRRAAALSPTRSPLPLGEGQGEGLTACQWSTNLQNWYQVVLFSVVSFAAAAFVLYRAFAFESLMGRDRRLAESSVVTATATVLSLGCTLLVLFVAFAVLMYVSVLTIFPEQLMETWATVGAATGTIDHVKLSLFLASMGVLAGSLGGRSDSRDLVRGVLFLDEES